MNSKLFFEKCIQNGINPAEINYSKSKSFSFSIFKGELINYSISEDFGISARGIFNGKMGFAAAEKLDNSIFDYLIEGIKDSASLIESTDEPIIFKGSDKYHKKNVYSKTLSNWSTDEKLKIGYEIEKRLIEADSRICDVEISFGEEESESKKINSFGLNLSNKTNDFYIYASIIIKEGDEIKSHGKVFFGNKPEEFEIDKFTKDIVDEGLSKLHGESLNPGVYKAVINQNSVASLLRALLSNLSSESIQKHTSLFEGKLGQQVLSKKLTVYEKPLEKNAFFSYFDYEGVAKYNKTVINKGVIETYFYNLANAKKDGVESTGNASGNGSKVGISFSNIFVKPGKLSQEELFVDIKNGVYITDVSGLHAGLNSTSGDFSLQSEGFHVVDGKIVSSLNLFTVSGNLFKMFNDIVAIGNDAKTIGNGVTTPSIAFKGLKISGE